MRIFTGRSTQEDILNYINSVDFDIDNFSNTVSRFLTAAENGDTKFFQKAEHSRLQVVRRSTPQMLVDLGMTAGKPLTIGANHLIRALVDRNVTSDAHDVGVDVMRQLPMLFDEPLCAWMPERRHLHLLLDDDAKDGSLLFCVVMKDASDGSNLIKTIYGVNISDEQSEYNRSIGKNGHAAIGYKLSSAVSMGKIRYIDRVRLKAALRSHHDTYPLALDEYPDKQVLTPYDVARCQTKVENMRRRRHNRRAKLDGLLSDGRGNAPLGEIGWCDDVSAYSDSELRDILDAYGNVLI